MLKHDFYADPTVFDQWQSTAHDWLCARLGKLCPYSWSAAFFLAALCCAAVGGAVFANLLLHALLSQDGWTWNRFMAQALTVVIALVACHAPVALAIKAWPEAQLPKWLARLARCCGVADDAPVSATPAPRPPTTAKPPVPAIERQALQLFFAEVRAAGVNVAIARALFAAGIRSAQQLRGAHDRDLLAIHGVGPATLHRLRIRFGCH